MAAIASPLPLRALEIAERLRFSPETRVRTSHTEKVWQYRMYQGGDPIQMIDWKQSARLRDLVVREHEKITVRDIYLWASAHRLAEEKQRDETLLILHALAYLLTFKERQVGWLGDKKSLTGTTTQIPLLFERGLRQLADTPPEGPLKNALLILMDDFSAPSDTTTRALRGYVAQGNHGFLIHTGTPLATPYLNWPFLNLSAATKTEDLISLILVKALDETR